MLLQQLHPTVDHNSSKQPKAIYRNCSTLRIAAPFRQAGYISRPWRSDVLSTTEANDEKVPGGIVASSTMLSSKVESLHETVLTIVESA